MNSHATLLTRHSFTSVTAATFADASSSPEAATAVLIGTQDDVIYLGALATPAQALPVTTEDFRVVGSVDSFASSPRNITALHVTAANADFPEPILWTATEQGIVAHSLNSAKHVATVDIPEISGVSKPL